MSENEAVGILVESKPLAKKLEVTKIQHELTSNERQLLREVYEVWQEGFLDDETGVLSTAGLSLSEIAILLGTFELERRKIV